MARRGGTSGSSRSSSKDIEVDFKGVETGGRTPEDGPYCLEVTEVEQDKGADSGEPYLKWEFQVVDDPKFKGCKVWHNTSLQPQALFNLKSVLVALGVEVPEGKLKLKLEEYVGMRCGAELVAETYKGKKKAKPVEFFPESELEDDAGGGGDGGKKDDKPAESSSGGARRTSSKKSDYEPKKNDTVSFDGDGDQLEGRVIKVDGDKVTVKVGKDEWEVEAHECKKVED